MELYIYAFIFVCILLINIMFIKFIYQLCATEVHSFLYLCSIFINALQLTYLFYCWWTLGLFLIGGYYKQHCYEHSCAYVLKRCLWASGGQQFSKWGLGTLGASWDLSEVSICQNYFHNNAEMLLAFPAHALTSVQWRARGNMTFWWLIECVLSSAEL